MSEIKVTIEVPGLIDALNAIANAVSTTKCVDDCKSVVTKAAAKEEPTQVAVNQADSATQVAPTVTPDAVPHPNMNNPEPVQPASEPSKIYTLAELSNAGAELCGMGKMGDLVALLNSFGVSAITQLPAEKYPAVAEGLKSLGAKL
ncbi:MAG: hypothetical protein NC177_14870 [Ruminococcus flavefaciens]|nr:hypothetical protein [Ruminococcus flavefaciens]